MLTIFNIFIFLTHIIVPWNFHPELLMRGPSWWLVTLYVILGSLAGSAIGFTIAMRTNRKFNKTVRQSAFFKQSGLAGLSKNPLVSKSLRLSLDEFDDLSDVDENEPINKKGNDNSTTYGS